MLLMSLGLFRYNPGLYFVPIRFDGIDRFDVFDDIDGFNGFDG